MAYSAFTHPRLVFRIQRGTVSAIEAVASTTVRPNSINTEPGVISV